MQISICEEYIVLPVFFLFATKNCRGFCGDASFWMSWDVNFSHNKELMQNIFYATFFNHMYNTLCSFGVSVISKIQLTSNLLAFGPTFRSSKFSSGIHIQSSNNNSTGEWVNRFVGKQLDVLSKNVTHFQKLLKSVTYNNLFEQSKFMLSLLKKQLSYHLLRLRKFDISLSLASCRGCSS